MHIFLSQCWAQMILTKCQTVKKFVWNFLMDCLVSSKFWPIGHNFNFEQWNFVEPFSVTIFLQIWIFHQKFCKSQSQFPSEKGHFSIVERLWEWERNLVFLMEQLQTLLMTRQTLKIGGLSILYWCLEFKRVSSPHSTQQFHMSRL